MRKITNINKGFYFKKAVSTPIKTIPNDWQKVDLPHTYNAKDGQDGGNDYFRGNCCYVKDLGKIDSENKDVFIEFNGVNSIATVYLNGNKVGIHNGGYSTFRYKINHYLQDKNILCVIANNGKNTKVYPQVADFTFYGGIYRDVNLITVDKTHFEMENYGTSGVKITPNIDGKNAVVNCKVEIDGNKTNKKLQFDLIDDNKIIQTKTVDATVKEVDFTIENVHLWNGRIDPHLYTLTVKILDNNKELDEITTNFGCRNYKIDAHKGFILNGKPYQLRGVARHQDRPEIGNALLPCHHEEDINLILEMGATTVRLAHYQHNQYFYDLCDKAGLVVWAEIPYISIHMDNGFDNTISQMTELITQNYNHPSIVVWGLSNEITVGCSVNNKVLLKNHKALNDLCHKMDKTRPTVVAVLSCCTPNKGYLAIPDVVSFNHYFGWYGSTPDGNAKWFDSYHKKYPDIPVGISEYGAEALNWHSSTPIQGDYTEEYQSYYHEEYIKQIIDRPYIWATHAWNMFDFAADARAEGGENGMNHKGLVSFDRKYKKDAFYAYKAWLSDEPFVHICSKRYVKRTDEVCNVTVYSNENQVELFANGKSIGKQTKGKYPFFYFEVKNEGITNLKAVAGNCTDESVIEKVNELEKSYIMTDANQVINWYDIATPDGYFSINDRIGDLLKTPQGIAALGKILFMCRKLLTTGKGQLKDIDETENSLLDTKDETEEQGPKTTTHVTINKSAIQMGLDYTVKRALSAANGAFTNEEIVKINRILNTVKKRSKK